MISEECCVVLILFEEGASRSAFFGDDGDGGCTEAGGAFIGTWDVLGCSVVERDDVFVMAPFAFK